MNERARSNRGKAKGVSIDIPVVQTGLPGGMSMANETGTWVIRDSQGQVRGLGWDPHGAVLAVFRVGEVSQVLNGWNNFQQTIKEGEEIDLK